MDLRYYSLRQSLVSLLWRLIILLYIASILPLQAQCQVLYNGSLNTFPASQGWTSVSFAASSSLSSGSVIFDSTFSGNNGLGGFSRNDHILNINDGYTLTLDLQILSESHFSTDRAGISFIALSSDLRGVELGFWADEVWAQNDTPTLFKHGEGAVINTISKQHMYTIQFSSSGYHVFADGNATPILMGALRNYSAFGMPYNIPNFLFIGDNTRSAQGRFALSSVTLSASAPEPSVLGLLIPALGMIGISGFFSGRRRF